MLLVAVLFASPPPAALDAGPYIARVSNALTAELAVPASGVGQPATTGARLQVRVDTGGRVVEYELVRSSGSPAFDAAVVRAVRHFAPAGPRRLPLPDEPKLLARILGDGMTLVVNEKPERPTAAPAMPIPNAVDAKKPKESK